ncbi:CU044_2847 family protein [Streptomyces sp. NPDC007088]|uniref:CU044_2847 family protein n=1 Tax=Streptomyces sp. NPDC007088 TaxID=3364773 RepID=UPI00367519CF
MTYPEQRGPAEPDDGVPLDDDIPIFVDFSVPAPRQNGETDRVFEDVRARGNGSRRVGEVVRNSYGPALDLAERCARQAAARFDALADGLRPDEVELQLSIRVEAGTVALAKATAEAQIQLTFRWSPRPRAGAEADRPAGREGAAPPPDAQA